MRVGACVGVFVFAVLFVCIVHTFVLVCACLYACMCVDVRVCLYARVVFA